MSNDLVVMAALLEDYDRAQELLGIVDGVVDTKEKAGAALELYCLGTGTTFADAVAQLCELSDPSDQSRLALEWLQEHHPELF